jgi:type VI secretion system protein ImpA
MALDVEKLLRPISEDAPSGEDITFDPLMMDLEKLAAGTAETQFSQGEEPDWREVRKLALELSQRSKHLHVLVLLTLASVRQEGSTGLRECLQLLRGTLETYWDSLWPNLDPDDDNDPTERVNLLSAISPPPDAFNDPLKIKERVLDMPATSSRQMGRFTLREMLKASGDLPLTEEESKSPPDLKLIRGALDDSPQEWRAALHDDLLKSRDHLTQIESLLANKVGSHRAPNFDVLKNILRLAIKVIAPSITGGEQNDGGAAGDADQAASAGDGSSAPSRATGPSMSGDVNSQADVVRVLGKIIEYYARAEPSSPVPVLLERAKALVGLSFADIVKNLTPAGFKQLQVFIGQSDENSDDY